MVKKLEPVFGLAHLADSRDDFYEFRKKIISEEVENLNWLHDEFDLIESDIIRSHSDVELFIRRLKSEEVSSLIIHLPVWADPDLCLDIAVLSGLPIALIGNMNPATSSIVGVLGAGGALDQVNISHLRILGINEENNKKKLKSWINSANCIKKLRGRKLGLFGGKSLGIFTAVVDPAQWMSKFGIGIEIIDQFEIVKVANSIPQDEVEENIEWFKQNIGEIQYGGNFSAQKLEQQMRSYLATKKLISIYGFDFVGVKCQPELSDGYVSQCISHSLCNSSVDAKGKKQTIVHACESDADGALSMEILKTLSGGKSTALMDIRWLNLENGLWTLANCGAMAVDFFKNNHDPIGLKQINMQPHVFGEGGGGALSGMVESQQVTLMRLCRHNREYKMHFFLGEAISVDEDELKRTTSVFPQAFIKNNVGMDFIENFGSNHIHIVNGDYIQDLIYFCQLLNIDYLFWK